jgi:hypothetical protein
VGSPQLCGDQRGLLRAGPQESHLHTSAGPDVLKAAVGSPGERAYAPGHRKTHLAQHLRLPVGRGERDGGTVAKASVVGAQDGRVGASKGLDRNVRVAQKDEVDVRAVHDLQ